MAGQVRAPRCMVSVNGSDIAVIEASVHVSIHQSADTFYAKLPLDNPQGLDERFWSDTAAPLPVTIKGTNDIISGGFTALFTGQVDEAQIILHERAVALKGRDKTAKLTDMKTSELWRNRSDQDVISDLAQRAGLSVKFGGDDDKAGLQFDQDYSHISDLDSAWNIIVELARHLGCIAFVNGSVLHIQPVDAPADGTFTVNYRRPTAEEIAQSTAVLLFCARNLNLAKDATVKAQSYRHKQGDTVTSEFKSKGKSGNDPLIFRFRGANLTKQQSDRVAKAHLKATLTHEREVHVDNYPGDVTIGKTNTLKLTGTGTKFDQSYIIGDIAHHFGKEGGYTMDVAAHNQDAGRGAPQQVQ